MDYELVRSGFRPDLFGESTRNPWTSLVDFGGAYAGLQVKAPAEGDPDAALSLIGEMTAVFRSLHVRKATLRRELPVAVALACATETPVLNLPAVVARERKGEERRLAFRQSRNTGGTLSVKR